ncbi:MAG: glycosyltransferase family 2 protein [Planctomycetota bacterium]
MIEFTLVIPAYNEARVIGAVLDELATAPGCREIIVVDDGSTDGTVAEATRRGVRVLSHPYNRGYGAALKTGIQAVTTDYVITCDADGQHGLSEVMRVVAEATTHDMVVGARDENSHQSFTRMPGKRILAWFANLLAARKIPDLNSGLRSFRTEVIRRYLHLMPDGFSFSTTSTLAMFRTGASVQYVSISTRQREGRTSSVKIFQDGFRVLMLIVNLTVLFNPMRVFVPLSFFFMGASVVYFILFSIFERVHITESMVLLFITGVILFFLGIVCEQVSAIRREIHR